MFRPFAIWLSHTSTSDLFQKTSWLIPASQTVHIVGLSLLFGSAVMIAARVLGIGRWTRSVHEVVTVHVPWIWRGFALALLSGVLQTIAEPVRQFVTPAFWAKMLMIVVVLILTSALSASVRRNPARWDNPSTATAGRQAFALVFIALWVAIIVCGRFIGYTWISHI